MNALTAALIGEKGESPVYRYLTRRLLQTIPILFGISIIVFALTMTMPGDPVRFMVNPRTATAESIDRMREKLGLKDPLPLRYVKWLGQTVTGNLGYSVQEGKAVTELLAERLPNTLLLTVTAFVIGLGLAIPLGIMAGTRPYSWLDWATSTFSYMGISLPSFFTALVFIYIFAFKLRWFPSNGMGTPGEPFSVLDLGYHLILPAFVLGTRDIAGYSRYMRSSILEVMRQDYVRTARAKGLTSRVVVYKHALRNSMIPIVTLLGLSLPDLFSGAIIAEELFVWPGMGQLSIAAISQRDYAVMLSTSMMFAVLVLIGNLVADMLYAVVDPRIRYA